MTPSVSGGCGVYKDHTFSPPVVAMLASVKNYCVVKFLVSNVPL